MSSVVIICLLLVYGSNGDILNNNKAALQRPIGLTNNYQMKNGFNRISKEASKVSNEALKVQNEALKM